MACRYNDFKGVNMMPQQHPKLTIKQDGKVYDLYDLPDGFVIKGDVNLRRKCLTELPDLSKVIVKGDFCCDCNQLTSLKGAPKEVGGNFGCTLNMLKNLKYYMLETLCLLNI